MNLTIREAGSDDLNVVRQLFQDYQTELAVDLCFQDFQTELDTLPGKYGAPRGGLFCAFVDDVPAGCAAFRPLAEGICELKRFYVVPEFRRGGIASQLLSKALNGARAAGYREAKLDTLARLGPALAFYTRHGFEVIPAYYPNPELDVVYMGLRLAGE